MACSLQDMLLRGTEGAQQQVSLVSAYEAEQLIQQLSVTAIEQVGGAKFLAQHDAIQKLNLQAHWNAQTHSDEFVMELLVSLDKLGVLVQELLVIEAWKERVFPLLRDHLADAVDSCTSYLLLYHEAAVANLLEVCLFHRSAAEAVGEDALLELADWALRKLAYLNTDAHGHAAATAESSPQQLLALSPAEELAAKAAETAFAAATCGVTLLRYLTDHLASLPLGLMGRLLSAHDAVMALLPLVDAPPWVRTRRDGKLEKFIDGRWQAVPPSDRLKLTQLDGQVWLALVNLLVEPACRAKYDPDEYRRGCILRLQRHMHELLLDQLPVLRQLARVLDEMALGMNSAAAAAAQGGGGASARLILEQVPLLRQALLRGKDWRAIAAAQQQQQFGADARQLARERIDSMVQSFELLCQMEQQQQQQQSGGEPAAAGGASLADGTPESAAVLAATVRVVCSRQVHAGGLWEHWCEFSASIDAAKPSEAVSISADGADAAVHGRRYRLAAMDPDAGRPLPTKGKVAVHFMGAVAEALLQLPEVPLRADGGAGAGGAPAGLWLTAGLLAADGFALQLRLRKADRPKERDRVEGGWFAYHPVGGAITVREGGPGEPERRAATRAAEQGARVSSKAGAARLVQPVERRARDTSLPKP